MHTKSAFFFEASGREEGEKRKDTKQQPGFPEASQVPGLFLSCRWFPGGGNRLIRRTSAALCCHPWQTAPHLSD